MATIDRRKMLLGAGSTSAVALLGLAGAPAASAYVPMSTSANTWAYNKKMVSSTSDAYFNTYVKKGEFLYMLAEAIDADYSQNWWAPFNDVPSDHPYRQAVAWAWRKGIITNSAGTSIGVDSNLTRGEMAMLIWRAFGSPRYSTMSKFLDVPSTHPYYNGLQWVGDNADLIAEGDGKFYPTWGIYRNQVNHVLYQLVVARNSGYGERWIPTSYNRSYTDARGVTSTYHIYANNINKNKPVGVLYYFEGDYKTGSYPYSRIGQPDGYLKNVLAVEAAKKNMILVAPRSPHRNDGGGNTWWVGEENNVAWFRSLARHLTSTFKLDINNVWMLGYSGGAEIVSKDLANHDMKGWFNRGGAIPVGGGDPHFGETPSVSMGIKRNMKLCFNVGLNDGLNAAGQSNWSALVAAKDGYDYHVQHKFRTNFNTIPNTNHYQYDFAAIFNRAYYL